MNEAYEHKKGEPMNRTKLNIHDLAPLAASWALFTSACFVPLSWAQVVIGGGTCQEGDCPDACTDNCIDEFGKNGTSPYPTYLRCVFCCIDPTNGNCDSDQERADCNAACAASYGLGEL